MGHTVLYIPLLRKSIIMGKERVESKNLFNFKPQGHLDEDIEAFYEKGKAGLTNNSLAAWSDSMKKMSEEEFVGMMRGMMDKNIATSSMVTAIPHHITTQNMRSDQK